MYTHNPSTRSYQSKSAIPASLRTPAPRHQYRQRDFGVGYGNSSGYASERRYASQSGATRFRCA